MIQNLHSLVLPLAIAAGVTLALLVARSVTLKLMSKWAKAFSRPLDGALVKVVRTPSFAWCLVLALYCGLWASETPAPIALPLFKAIHIVLILSVTLALANFAAALVQQLLRSANGGLPASGLAIVVVKGSVGILGVLLALSVLGISIAPFLTALGVGGLAVALAFKDTLENLFAGLYLLTDRTIRVGDHIRLEGGQEGRVEDIGWRTTRLETGLRNSVIIPNSKLSQGVVINLSLPDRQLSVAVLVRTSLEADASTVEDILYKVAKEGTSDVPGLLSLPAPAVRMTFGDGTLDFALTVSVRHYVDQSLVQHELRKRILKEFRQAGVKFPQPAAVRPS